MGEGSEVRISVFRSPQPLIRIHPSYLQGTLFTPTAPWRCTCGRHSALADVLPDPTIPVSMLMLSTVLADKVLLGAAPGWVQARIENGGVTLGPTIGILCNPKWNHKRASLAKSKQLPVLEKLSEAGRQAGALVYVFGIQDVDFQHQRIRGYVFHENRWQQAQLPLPDAIYDQVISRKVETSKTYAGLRDRLSRMYGARIFNDGFFDKWQVHEWLTADPKTRSHIPQSSRYTNVKSAVAFIKSRPVTFLKPVHGSLGLGIVRVTCHADGNVTYELKKNDTRIQIKAASAEAAVDALKGRLQSRPYMLQEGIALAKYHERPFDVRIVLQRDGSGAWKRTKMFARVAKLGDFTSNISSGGEAIPVGKVLLDVFAAESRRRRCQSGIRRVSTAITSVIESQSKKLFGELGIDVGVDGQGNVWIIEVNSKPWKSPTTEKGRQDLVDLAFSRPIQYAIRLTQTK